MPTPPTPHTDSEIAAHLAHLAADVVLPHDIAQRFSFATVQTLLAISRQTPAVDREDARQIVRAALAAIATAEVMALREARP